MFYVTKPQKVRVPYNLAYADPDMQTFLHSIFLFLSFSGTWFMFYDEIGEDYNDVQDNSWRGTGKKEYFHFCQSK